MHFTVEVMCFYTVYRLFDGGSFWWTVGLMYDVLAFAPQAAIGDYCERHPDAKPGRTGFVLMTAGSAVMLVTAILLLGGGVRNIADTALLAELTPGLGIAFWVLEIIGLTGLTIGNAFVHIDGAIVTLRVSEGRLAPSAIFVGGGSFGVITGRLLSCTEGTAWIPFVLAAMGLTVAEIVRERVRGNTFTRADVRHCKAFDFTAKPCAHRITAKRPDEAVIVILGLVVAARAYIGYGLPTAWNRTTLQTVFLFVFMGTGKMLGGILADRFGARRVGVISCLAAVPLLLVSNEIMWLSLVAVALFSMTMAITLGGLVSVLPSNPGVAFGITTLGLMIGTIPPFWWGIPGRTVCDILITVISVLAAAGLWYCLKKDSVIPERRKNDDSFT